MATLPISEFLTERLEEYDDTFELRAGTGFESLFFKPVEFIVQPLRDEADQIFTAQSFRRILLTESPDDFSEESVDALANNLFVYRNEGDYSSGIARIYYAAAVDREWPSSGTIITGSNGITYTNPSPYLIKISQMGAQIEEGLYYYDIPVQATEKGDAGDLDIDGLVAISNDPDAISLTNKAEIKGGVDRESNTELIERTKNSIAVRDLVTGKGFNAILFETFPNQITELRAIGMGDLEMMRDIQFNCHIGGKIDGYFKSPDVQIGEAFFTGLLIDTTRQAFASANALMSGTAWTSVGNTNLDRSNGKVPTVEEVKPETKAVFVSTVDLSSPVDLSSNEYAKIGVGGVAMTIRIAGTNPTLTSRNELVAIINEAYGSDIAFPEGNTLKIVDPTSGKTSQVLIDEPDAGTSGVELVFGLAPAATPELVEGDGPIVFVEGTHYEMDDGAGNVKRIVGSTVSTPTTTGVTEDGSNEFKDVTPFAFTSVEMNDIITLSGADEGDYRVLDIPDDNTLILDAELTTDASGVNYVVKRTGIKDQEIVYVQYWYNPLSIDIGKLVKLDELGRERGIRPGRENQTITDLAFLRIRLIELVDPISLEPIGEILEGKGGWGAGGWGKGPYGIGSNAAYRLIVNEPNDRFSMWEDSFITINSGYQGLSFRVEYEYVPEAEALHEFVRSETERVLDGDILMKHFLPAYVTGVIQYSVDETDTSIPDNDTLQKLVREFVNVQKSGSVLDYTDIRQYILQQTDPFLKYGTSIKIFKLTANIHNTDGSTSVTTGDDYLQVPILDPFPKETDKPLSPRISHWLADDMEDSGLILERISDSAV